MKNKLTLIAAQLLLCTCFALPYHSFAQAGSLDLTFDTDGKVTTDIGNGNDDVRAIAIQTDGKIVVAGYSEDTSFIKGFGLVRYNANGSLDLSFDNDGKVTTPIGTAGLILTVSVAIQSDGKIVMVGTFYNGSDNDFVLVRYNTNGSVDNTFGTGGKVITDFGASDDGAYAVAIQSDGKIIVAGYSLASVSYDFALVRYNTNGSLDNTFGTGGKATTAIGTANEIAYSVAIQSDGKIVAAGYSLSSVDIDLALVRYNTNGSLDNTFDTDGIVTTDIGPSHNDGRSLAIQTDGKIVVAGIAKNGSILEFAVVRYNTNGSLDNTFDTDGIVTTIIGDGDIPQSVAIQSDGKIVVAGNSIIGSSRDFVLVRYNTNGSLDNSFDTDGNVTTDFGGSYDYGYSVAIQSDGKIVVAGSSQSDFAVVRYNNTISSSINETTVLSSGIDVYPNPFSTIATLYSGNPLRNATLTLYNVFGQQVKRMNSLNIPAGKSIELTRDHLPNGIYWIELKEDHQIISTNKVVITD